MFSGFLGSINYPVKVKVIRMDVMFLGKHFVLNPVKQAFPVIYAYEYDWETGNFTCLYQRNSLEGFIHSTKTTRQDYEALRVLHKHYLPDKKVIKLQQFVTVDVFIMEL